MKIAYVLDEFPKISQTFVLNEILEMQRKGVTVEVFSLDRGRDEKKHRAAASLRVRYLRPRRGERVLAHVRWFFSSPVRYLSAFFRLVFLRTSVGAFARDAYAAWRIAATRPDHVHAHFGWRASDVAMLTGLLGGIPYSFTTHRADLFDVVPRNYRWKSRWASNHVTISEFNRAHLVRELGVEDRNVRVVHCGVDLESFENGPTSEDLLLCVARLEKEKGLETLVRACARLRDAGIEFTCVIAGEGSRRQALEALIAELELKEFVTLLGETTEAEVRELLAAARVVALPSRSEGIPVSLMEAMAAGVPVVATRVNGVPELVEDGVNGFLVEPGNAGALAGRIAELWEDETLRRIFAGRAHAKVAREFDLRQETQKLLNLWEARPQLSSSPDSFK